MNVEILKSAFAGLVLSVSSFANAGLISLTGDGGWVDASSLTKSVNSLSGEFITDVNVWVDFSKCSNTSTGSCDTFNTGGTYDNEIEFSLMYNGINVLLLPRSTFTNSNSGSITEFITFDNQALQTLGTSPESGNFQPTNALNVFNGLSATGSWAFTFTDTTGSDGLEVHRWGVDITTTSVPEPTTLAIFALGIMGLASRRSLLANKNSNQSV